MKFALGDWVSVTFCDRLPDVVGKIGSIVGIGEDEGVGVSYAVAFSDVGVVSLWEDELQPHGDALAQ